jgi:excinuclease UvrABC nuclease subunit
MVGTGVVNGPGVYAFMKNREFLYIGSTGNLSKRPMKRNKGHLNRFQAILEATHTKFYPCDTRKRAYQLEELFIREHKPPYNQRCPCGEADLARTWQIIKENW